MSMIYELHQATDATIESLLAVPESILKFLGMERRPQAANRGCLWSLLNMFRTNLAAAPQPEQQPEPKESPQDKLAVCDLDKAWHGLHFLFSGSDWEGDLPAASLLRGGEPIGDIDVGYGPARAHTSAETAQFAAYLETIDHEQLRSRFDPELMMRESIYPTIWDRDPEEDDTLGYLLEYFDILTEFVNRTANLRLGLVTYLG